MSKPDPIRHGERSGYVAHRRLGEQPCKACSDANTSYQAEYRARLRTLEAEAER